MHCVYISRKRKAIGVERAPHSKARSVQARGGNGWTGWGKGSSTGLGNWSAGLVSQKRVRVLAWTLTRFSANPDISSPPTKQRAAATSHGTPAGDLTHRKMRQEVSAAYT